MQEIIEGLRSGTKTERARLLFRILVERPKITLLDLADLIGQSAVFVTETLNLRKRLVTEAFYQFDRGEINVANAYALAKLPKLEQATWIEAARNEEPAALVPRINARVKELKPQSSPRAAASRSDAGFLWRASQATGAVLVACFASAACANGLVRPRYQACQGGAADTFQVA
jgi:hypothetical protein